VFLAYVLYVLRAPKGNLRRCRLYGAEVWASTAGTAAPHNCGTINIFAVDLLRVFMGCASATNVAPSFIDVGARMPRVLEAGEATTAAAAAAERAM